MYNFSNQTKFGIKNDTERYIWAGWLAFVFLSSLLGDSLILIASIKCKAFNLHKMLVTFIQHIAVSDLLRSVGCVGPASTSAFFNVGSPHRFIDYVWFFTAYLTGASGSWFTTALTLGKLLLLKYPLKLRSMSQKHANKLCAGIWVVCFSVPVSHLIIDKDDVIFDYRKYSSEYRYSSTLWKIITPLYALFFLFIPEVTVVISTLLILKKARKVVRKTQQSLRWQGVTTVVLTATVYTIACLPITIYFIAEHVVEQNPDKPENFYAKFNRVANGSLQLNVLSNFFIYSLTVASFRRFLVAKFYEILAVSTKVGNIIVCLSKIYGL